MGQVVVKEATVLGAVGRTIILLYPYAIGILHLHAFRPHSYMIVISTIPGQQIVQILNKRSRHPNTHSLSRQAVPVLRFGTSDLVFDLAVFAQQNDDLGPTVFPMFQPPQFGAFPCEDGGRFLVLLDFAAIRYAQDSVLLVHWNNWNLLEKFHTIERRYLWDEREHRRPLVLASISASRDLEISGRVLTKKNSRHCMH